MVVDNDICMFQLWKCGHELSEEKHTQYRREVSGKPINCTSQVVSSGWATTLSLAFAVLTWAQNKASSQGKLLMQEFMCN